MKILSYSPSDNRFYDQVIRVSAILTAVALDPEDINVRGVTRCFVGYDGSRYARYPIDPDAPDSDPIVRAEINFSGGSTTISFLVPRSHAVKIMAAVEAIESRR